MSYFSECYPSLRLPIEENDLKGLRRAQVGAIHAIAAYFTLPRHEPGIIVMPTGSGKTAVICCAPYVLRADRVLILTPSQLVRAQITDELQTLAVLKRNGVLPPELAAPNVKEIKKRLETDEAWDQLRPFNFIVSTPQCVSPGIAGIAKAPSDLFDLVLMDEAHHSEAPRWADILQHFQVSRKLLFTATPFRRDKRELKGKVIYSYPLRLAHEDKIFGKLQFIPVNPEPGQNHDAVIAKNAETVYSQDKTAGLDHRIMVRTDSKKRAEALAKLYAEQTRLKLAVVHSGHTLKSIRKTLARLRSAELDGIVCVAMMGEGFDFPQLKIAAIHAPHKSLAVTLQFIGRFARTSGDRLGDAKFLAVPQDIQAETNELYRESAAWQDIVSNLSAGKIERELRIKELADSFAPMEGADIDVADAVLMDFKPYFHVKIYRLPEAPDLRTLPTLSEDISVLRHEISEEFSSSILLLRQITRPRGTDLAQFARVEHDLVVLHYDAEARLLFINSSRRTLEFYRVFEDFYGGGLAQLISGPRINRVLSGIQNPDFFSVGLKNTVQNSNTESYQIKSGPSAQNAISPTDGRLYQRGHVFGKGVNEDGKEITIGYSSSSKVWSNYTARIGELIEWCQGLAQKLRTKGAVVTGTPLDGLEVGEEIEALPAGVIGVGWPENVFRTFPRALLTKNGGQIECQLLDLELNVIYSETEENLWKVGVTHEFFGEVHILKFSFEEGRPTLVWNGPPPDIKVAREEEEIALLDYLRHYPLAFYLEDFSRLEGNTLVYNRNVDHAALPADARRQFDWAGAGIDITLEFPDGEVDFEHPTTIQEFIGKTLVESDASLVFYDHGSGEIADFIGFRPGDGNSVTVSLYHCKGSGGASPGDRVDDAYEVCGQVVKSLVWLKKRQTLRARVLDRDNGAGKQRFLKGARNEFLELLSDESARKMNLEIVVVQPGISIANTSLKLGHILSAASDYVRRANGARMIHIGSA